MMSPEASESRFRMMVIELGSVSLVSMRCRMCFRLSARMNVRWKSDRRYMFRVISER